MQLCKRGHCPYSLPKFGPLKAGCLAGCQPGGALLLQSLSLSYLHTAQARTLDGAHVSGQVLQVLLVTCKAAGNARHRLSQCCSKELPLPLSQAPPVSLNLSMPCMWHMTSRPEAVLLLVLWLVSLFLLVLLGVHCRWQGRPRHIASADFASDSGLVQMQSLRHVEAYPG